jgi:hypothetical protein
MIFSKYLNIKYFLIAFLIGITFVYFSGSDKKEIIIYPNPYEVIQYKDKTNNCFVFKPKQVKCPDDISKIKTFPFQ